MVAAVPMRFRFILFTLPLLAGSCTMLQEMNCHLLEINDNVRYSNQLLEENIAGLDRSTAHVAENTYAVRRITAVNETTTVALTKNTEEASHTNEALGKFNEAFKEFREHPYFLSYLVGALSVLLLLPSALLLAIFVRLKK
jgi:hypothetical protein